MCHSLSRICGGVDKKRRRKKKDTQARPCKKSLRKSPHPPLNCRPSRDLRCWSIRPSSRPIPSADPFPLCLSSQALSQRPVPPLSQSTSCSSSAAANTATLPCIASGSFTIQQKSRFPPNSTPLRFSLVGLSESCPIVGVNYQEQHARLSRSSQTYGVLVHSMYTF